MLSVSILWDVFHALFYLSGGTQHLWSCKNVHIKSALSFTVDNYLQFTAVTLLRHIKLKSKWSKMLSIGLNGLETPEYIDKWSTRDCQNHMFFFPHLCCYENTIRIYSKWKNYSLSFINFTLGLFVTSKRFNSSTTPTRKTGGGAGARVKERAQLSAPRTALRRRTTADAQRDGRYETHHWFLLPGFM